MDSGGGCVNPHGLLDVDIMHIPKTGVISLHSDLGSLKLRVTSDEKCHGHDWHEDPCLAGVPTVTYLRSPRSHVLSQFLQCSHEARRNTAGHFVEGRPFPEQSPEIMDNFDSWLGAFDPSRYGYGAAADWNCYNPTNMMTRYLACGPRATTPHHADGIGPPSLALALNRLSNFTLVGLTEYYAESLCLVEYVVRRKLPGWCSCAELSDRQMAHETHGVPAHDASLMSSWTARKVDSLTELDRHLYRAGAGRFLREVTRMERDTGREVLCKKRREELVGLL